MKHFRICLLCLFVFTFAVSPLVAQSDILSAGHDALKAGDLAGAIKAHHQYLLQNPEAPDAAKEALHLAFILNAAKLPIEDVRQAFVDVQTRYPQSEEAKESLYRCGMLSIREKDHVRAKTIFESVVKDAPESAAASRAKFPLANYCIKEARLDEAIDLFHQVAADDRIEPAMQDEAMLQTGFLFIQQYFAPRLILRDGQLAPSPTGESQFALLRAARLRLAQVADELGRKKENLEIHQTAAAYAECGVAEVYLLQGIPTRAESWYRRALSHPKEIVQAPVTAMALQGLGVSLSRQGRFHAAADAFDAAIANPATGTVLYGLLVPDFLTAQAQMWRASIAERLGDRNEALRLAKISLERLGEKEPLDPDARKVWIVSSRYIRDVENLAGSHTAVEPGTRVASIPSPEPAAVAAEANAPVIVRSAEEKGDTP